ncbi:MAG TPA: glycosyltransferase, partial [Solirubrobacteraceae bacterium]|nr:glycosyltransferase [Solirubrobacteraceae bacterium]
VRRFAVSVVIPTRDRWPLLAMTLASVRAQQDVDLEIVVVDDGSPAPMPSAGAPWDDPRLVIVRHERSRGVAPARNAGIRAASGDWVAFLDDDDLWAPRKLHDQIEAAQAAGAAFAYSRVVAFREDVGPVGLWPPPDPAHLRELLPALNAVPAGASNVVVRAAVLAAVGGFDTSLSHLADWDMWIRLAAAGTAAACQPPHVGYRLHPGNMRSSVGGVHREMRTLDRKHRHRTLDAAGRMEVYRWLVEGQVLAGRRVAAACSQALGALYCRSPSELARVPGLLRTRDEARTGPLADDRAVAWLRSYLGAAPAAPASR